MENWKILPIAIWICILLLIMGKLGYFGAIAQHHDNTIELSVLDVEKPPQVIITNMENFGLTRMRITINKEYTYSNAISRAPRTAVTLDKLLFLGPSYKPAAGVKVREIEVIADQGSFYKTFEA